jgi:hypothetical protein
MDKTLELKIEKLIAQNKKIERTQGDILKYLELIYKEREILEDIELSVKSLGEKMVYQKGHVDNILKDVKGEVIEQNLATQEKVAEVKKEVKITQDQNEEIKKEVTAS